MNLYKPNCHNILSTKYYFETMRTRSQAQTNNNAIEVANALLSLKERFIESAKQVHGDKYDYSQVVFSSSATPETILSRYNLRASTVAKRANYEPTHPMTTRSKSATPQLTPREVVNICARPKADTIRKFFVEDPASCARDLRIDFEEASREWRRNKRNLGNGCYEYK